MIITKSSLEFKSVKKIYHGDGFSVEALKDVSLKISIGEFVGITGPSGSGKSTLLNMAGMLDKPSYGTITIDGVDVGKLSENQQTSMRNKKIGFIFQFSNLIPELTAIENVMLPGMIAGVNNESLKNKALTLLQSVGLENKAKSGATQLSGGEMQRVAVARSLINDPAIVLADEPTGNLDSKNSYEIINLMRDLNKRNKQTFVIISHDPSVIKKVDRIISVKDGKIDESEI